MNLFVRCIVKTDNLEINKIYEASIVEHGASYKLNGIKCFYPISFFKEVSKDFINGTKQAQEEIDKICKHFSEFKSKDEFDGYKSIICEKLGIIDDGSLNCFYSSIIKKIKVDIDLYPALIGEFIGAVKNLSQQDASDLFDRYFKYFLDHAKPEYVAMFGRLALDATCKNGEKIEINTNTPEWESFTKSFCVTS